jgi:hypothetical protein
VISNLKIYCLEEPITMIVLLVTMDLLSFLILIYICSLDVVHPAMSHLKLSISKIWRLSIALLVIYSVWASFFICSYLVRVFSRARHTTKCLMKIEVANLDWRVRSMKKLIRLCWICWRKCLKLIHRKGSMQKQRLAIRTSKRSYKPRSNSSKYRIWISFN